MNIYIPTCDKYIHAIEALQYTIIKYWTPKSRITILGYQSPVFDLAPNWNFVQLHEHDRGPDFWATDLRRFFEQIDDDFFIYLNDDVLILPSVDRELLEYLTQFINQDQHKHTLGRICLTKDLQARPYKIIDKQNNFNIIEGNQNNIYRISTQSSIWNRSYFLKYLENGMTPWQFEVDTWNKAKNDGWRILGSTGRYCITFTHLYVKGAFCTNSWYKENGNNKVQLPNEDIQIIKKILKI